MIACEVEIKLSGLERFQKLASDPSAGPIRNMLKQWAARYRSFTQIRFEKFSKGGGDWPPLAPATIKARRKGKAARASLKRRIEKLEAKLKGKGGNDGQATPK